MSRWSPRNAAEIAALVARHPLAWVVSGTPSFHATPLPLVADLAADGSIAALVGHFALANPQVEALRQQARALVLFQGAQGYISPELVTQPQWAPTWNYAVARFEVEIAFSPQDNGEALDRLIAHMEGYRPDRWTVAKMGERYEPMSRHIIAFRATVLSCEATFKLGQDERPESLAQILAGHPDTGLAAAMREANQPLSRT
ncbi:PaiB family negative transcriptional regulator [Novosphingobium sp. PhB55]|uniref:FMN-binding negative transcriptional regulator n=1 Tax=Novosphingobium sp. PhB55 TaxID=2485106 RepID=UPI001066393C|nr:FMN-binding negative transcriptional regulator [Novosphingobium sp. PhB55]TDW67577.1 PaiB family negative transcriptional regulator [Novosphingobium sp. PhB55]